MSDASAFPLPHDETGRLRALAELGILDSGQDEGFDLLTEVAAQLCDAPFAFVVMVDSDRLWVKSAFGMSCAGVELPRGDSPCSHVITQSEVMVVEDMLADPRMQNMPHQYYRMYAGANLQTSTGHNIGTLCVEDSRVRRLTEVQRELLRRLARQAMQLVELRAARSVLARLSVTDPLTGLANRRGLSERIAAERAQALRHGTELSLVFIDIDHFKKINDTCGHVAGDQVLVEFAALLRRQCRDGDFVARFGGEEFCVLLPHTGAEAAVTWSDRCRVELAEHHFEARPRDSVTASFGVAVTSAAQPLDADSLFRAADAAVYVAKSMGRNRVELAPIA